MTRQDVYTLSKKIGVGLVVLIVPLVLFLLALWLVRHLL